MKNIVIFDLDGTLADIRHRVHHVSSSVKAERDWKSFYQDIDKDVPNSDVCQLCRTLRLNYEIWILTGRSEEYRSYTENWLFWNNIHYDELRMRSSDDMRKDIECKFDMLSEEEQKGVLVIFEDRTQVVEMWRQRNITVCQVDNGEF